MRIGRVGVAESTALLTIYTGTQVFLNYPSRIAEESASAGWIVPLVSGVIVLGAFLITYAALKRFPGESVIHVVDRMLGPYVGIAVTLLFALLFLTQTALVMREFTETVVTTVLPETPSTIVAFTFMVVVVYFAYSGLEGLTRISIFLIYFLGIGLFALLVLPLTWFNPHLLQPIWGRGISNILTSGLVNISQFMNVLILAIIYPYVRRREQFLQIGVVSIALTAVLFSAVIAIFVGTFSGAASGTVPFPLYQLARLIYVGRFIQRLESVFVFLWTAAAVIQMGLGLWMTAHLYASAFRMPTYRPLLFPLALLLFVLAGLPPDFPTVLALSKRILEPYGWIGSIALPMVLSVVVALIDRFRQRSSGRRAEQGGGAR